MARIPPIENFRSGSPPARPLAQIGTRSGSRTQHQTQTQTQSLNMGQAMAGSVVYERLNEFEDLDEEDQLDEGDSSSDDKHLPKEPLPTAPRNERLNELEDFDEEDQLDEGDHSSDDDYQPDEPLRTSPRKKRKLVSGSPQAIRPLPDNRILDRKHRAAARILHSKGWDAADLSDASPIKNVSPKTFSRVIANDYADKDNVDSDDEHNTYVQFYEANRNRLKPRLTKSTSPSKKRDRPQRCRLAVIAAPTNPSQVSNAGAIVGLSGLQPSNLQPPSVPTSQPAPSAVPLTVETLHQSSPTYRLEAFLQSLNEPSMENVLPILQAGGITDDKNFLALLKWSDEDLTHFLKRFENGKGLTIFQGFVLERGLINFKKQQ